MKRGNLGDSWKIVFDHNFTIYNPSVTYLVIPFSLASPEGQISTSLGQIVPYVYLSSISKQILIIAVVFLGLALFLLVCWLQLFARWDYPVLWSSSGELHE